MEQIVYNGTPSGGPNISNLEMTCNTLEDPDLRTNWPGPFGQDGAWTK